VVVGGAVVVVVGGGPVVVVVGGGAVVVVGGAVVVSSGSPQLPITRLNASTRINGISNSFFILPPLFIRSIYYFSSLAYY
jgi:hypothetical protein